MQNIKTDKRLMMLSGLVLAIFVATGSVNATAAPVMTDLTIRDAVEDELLFDQAVESHGVTVQCRDGIVILKGQVRNLLAKERAAEIGKTVKGVRSVVNQLEIWPKSLKNDQALHEDIKDALLLDPVTESYKIDVDVKNHEVTLKGTVDSWREKDLAEKEAKGVFGTESVKNAITVVYAVDRKDTDIKADIEQTLRWDTLVDDALIDVKVKDGAVTLTGIVGSAAEKTQAYKDAWVAGIKEIDTTGLRVERWARDADLRKTKYTVKSDEKIRQAVEKALFYDPRVLADCK